MRRWKKCYTMDLRRTEWEFGWTNVVPGWPGYYWRWDKRQDGPPVVVLLVEAKTAGGESDIMEEWNGKIVEPVCHPAVMYWGALKPPGWHGKVEGS